ncbi:MAG: AAA family ATPase, partial [Prevotella sp.]|nr:AAA family ATPase [Prevotella sp.]
MADFKRIPYGISNFKQLRRESLYFVDKSEYIQRLEDTDHFLFLIRPRRFGKSIFLNMLRAYYDVNEADNFDTLFDGLWIKEHPTPEKCGYQVLYLDF